MTKYNLSRVMKDAWTMFKNWSGQYDFDTFAEALKASWAEEKAYVAEKEEEAKQASSSEEVKAWNWATKKLNVVIEMDDATKMWNVNNMANEMFGKSVWQVAMKAVNLFLANRQAA